MFDIVNRSGSLIPNAHFAIAIDPDVGNAANDRAGLFLNRLFHIGPDTIRVRNTGYCYSNDGVPSGAVAVILLDAANGLGMTAFKLFTLTDADPRNDFERYLALSGHNWTPPYAYAPYDSIDPAPADKRFLLSTGPFDLQPDSSGSFVYAVIGTPFSGYDTSSLAWRCRRAEQAWQRILGVAERGSESADWLTTAGPSVFNRATGLRLNLPAGEKAIVTVCDASGRAVTARMSLLEKPTGAVRLEFGSLPPGVYLVQTRSAGDTRTHKVLYLGE